MDRVSKRELLLYPNKYLKPSEFVVTMRGEDTLVVTIKPYTKPVSAPVYDNISRYGCGCEKKEGDNVCNKHQRL